jgi:hypothetical protein
MSRTDQTDEKKPLKAGAYHSGETGFLSWLETRMNAWFRQFEFQAGSSIRMPEGNTKMLKILIQVTQIFHFVSRHHQRDQYIKIYFMTQ